MPLVVKTFTFVNGTVADADEVNTDFDILYNLVNGALDEDNLAAVLDFSAKTITLGVNTAFVGDIVFQSNEGAANAGTISHANSAARAWSFPDADGIIVLTTGTQVVPQHTHADGDQGGQLVIDDAVGAGDKTGTGDVVLQDTPTILTPVIADFTNANHDHEDAAGGGTLDAAAIQSGTFDDARISQSSVTQYATQVVQAATGATDNPATSDTQINANGFAKAWGTFTTDGGGNPTLVGSYNITSVALGGGGFTVTLDRDMANANYAAITSCAQIGGFGLQVSSSSSSKAAGTFIILTQGDNGSGVAVGVLDNLTVDFSVFGTLS